MCGGDRKESEEANVRARVCVCTCCALNNRQPIVAGQNALLLANLCRIDLSNLAHAAPDNSKSPLM